MIANIKGALNRINQAYKLFEHNGKPMSKNEVKSLLEYGLKRGYKYTNEFTDEEVNKILNVGGKEGLAKPCE